MPLTGFSASAFILRVSRLNYGENENDTKAARGIIRVTNARDGRVNEGFLKLKSSKGKVHIWRRKCSELFQTAVLEGRVERGRDKTAHANGDSGAHFRKLRNLSDTAIPLGGHKGTQGDFRCI